MNYPLDLRCGDMARAIYDANLEMNRTDEMYGDFASMHEAYGVLLEEVTELFESVRMKQNMLASGGQTRGQCIRAEAIQVAAVALRIVAQAERVTR